MELNTKLHLHCLPRSASTSESRVGLAPQFQVYFGGKGVMFFRGFTFQDFTLAIWLLCSPHKAVPLVLGIWTARFGELSWNIPPRQLSSCLWDEEKDNYQDCSVWTVLYPCSFSVFLVFCVHKHGYTWTRNLSEDPISETSLHPPNFYLSYRILMQTLPGNGTPYRMEY